MTAGSGAVHTISRDGAGIHPLAEGSVVWFSPGTVHRLVNDGDLRLVVVMQNSGLPEAGDAVLTFPSRDPRRPGRLRPRCDAARPARPPPTSAPLPRARGATSRSRDTSSCRTAMRTAASRPGTSCTPAPPGSCSRRSRTGSGAGTRPSPPRPSARGHSSPRSPSGDAGRAGRGIRRPRRGRRRRARVRHVRPPADVGLARRPAPTLG